MYFSELQGFFSPSSLNHQQVQDHHARFHAASLYSHFLVTLHHQSRLQTVMMIILTVDELLLSLEIPRSNLLLLLYNDSS